jgi:hypothetical protein
MLNKRGIVFERVLINRPPEGVKYSKIKNTTDRHPAVYEIIAIDPNTGINYSYIGSTIDANYRMAAHSSELRKNRHVVRKLQEIYNAGGKIVAYIFFTATRDEAYQLEEMKIRGFNNPEVLLNVALDVRNSMTGRNHSSMTKQLMSYVRKGTIQSPEVIAKRTEGLRRFRENNKSEIVFRNKHVCVDGVIYDSLKDAAKILGVHPCNVGRKALSNKHPNIYFVPFENFEGKPYGLFVNENVPTDVKNDIIQTVEKLGHIDFTVRVSSLNEIVNVIPKNIRQEVILRDKGSTETIVKIHSPGYDMLSEDIKRKLCFVPRVVIANGVRSEFLITWSEDGAETGKEVTAKTGMAGLAIKIASDNDIRVFNFQRLDARDRLYKFLNI